MRTHRNFFASQMRKFFVFILVVYVFHSLFVVTFFSVINRKLTVVQHYLFFSEVFSLSLNSCTYHFVCNELLLHLVTIYDTHTHTHKTNIKR
jgi:hypothetical protein